MKKVYIFLILSISIIFISGCHQSFNIKKVNYENNILKLMSYNIRTYMDENVETTNETWDERKELIIKQIEDNTPDIICMQEVRTNQYHYIVKNLKGYSNIYFQREIFQAVMPEGLLILYRNDRFDMLDVTRYWLSETPDEASFGWGSKYERFSVQVKFTINETKKVFYIVNTHLDLGASDIKIKSLDLINQHLDNSTPAIIMGDFNFKYQSKPYNYAIKLFVDARAFYNGEYEKITYNAYGNKQKEAILDYAFLKNNQFSITDYQVIDETFKNQYASDHFPIIMTLKV